MTSQLELSLQNRAPAELPQYYGISKLTPVEEHQGVLFKRDDLFKAFSDMPVSGGKVRQCLALVLRKLQVISREFDYTIATAASVHSPQSVIVARIAKEFGMRCLIGHGAKDPLKHKAMRLCADYGAELVQLCASNSYNSVLISKLKQLQTQRRFFTINFGYQAETEPEAIIETVAHQVRNLPGNLNTLVINVGSGVSANAILHGIDNYWRGNVHFLTVHLIQPFGYVRNTRGLNCKSFHYHRGSYGYAKPFPVHVGKIELDAIYESKAFDLARKLRLFDHGKTCFWLIGNSNGLR